jgi:hypothetical protein
VELACFIVKQMQTVAMERLIGRFYRIVCVGIGGASPVSAWESRAAQWHGNVAVNISVNKSVQGQKCEYNEGDWLS